MPQGYTAEMFGRSGLYRWMDSAGLQFQTVQRRRPSRLMPMGQTCPECQRTATLQGPNRSWRLAEPFWVLRCAQHHSTYWLMRHGTLVPMTGDQLEKLHTWSRYRFPIPLHHGFRMNPQRKTHMLADGGSCEILHCRCRHCKADDPKRDVFLVLPRGETATRDEWGVYRWIDTDTGKECKTLPRRAADGTSLTWRQKAELELAEKKVSDLRQQLKAAEARLEALQNEQQSSEERVFYAVNAAIPRLEALLSVPEIKQNPRLLRNWSHPNFGSDEIEGAYQASISRKPASRWPWIGACWFVALITKYDIRTVRKYYSAVADRTEIR